MENRFISKGGWLISDIIEVTNILKTKLYLLTVDLEKTFDLINHFFIFQVLQKFWVGKNFIKWIKFILKNQDPYVINGGKTATKYFKLKKETRHEDPLCTCFFSLILKVIFAVTKLNKC